MGEAMAKINAFDDEVVGRIDASRALGSCSTLMYIYEIEPGGSSSPYHYEYEEEWLLVLAGTLVLRTPDGEQTLARGDLICFPAGPDGAHKLVNRGASTARTMLFSANRTPAVTVYPDSDKIGVWSDAGDADGQIFKRATAVPYSDGEDGWERDTGPWPS
jgi:uncharacterized cupin superfamily protein